MTNQLTTQWLLIDFIHHLLVTSGQWLQVAQLPNPSAYDRDTRSVQERNVNTAVHYLQNRYYNNLFI